MNVCFMLQQKFSEVSVQIVQIDGFSISIKTFDPTGRMITMVTDLSQSHIT